MAKELGFQPQSLIRNIPSPSQKWKAPINDWVRSLHEQKFGSRERTTSPVSAPVAGSPSVEPSRPHQVIEFRNPEHPWPDRPEIPELVIYEPQEFDDEVDFGGGIDTFRGPVEPPSEEETDEENTLMLRRQCLFRWAAQVIAVELSKLPEVQKVAAFGAVGRPLEAEVPRFRQFRRHGIEVLHECADLDLAVWTNDLSRLREMKKSMNHGLLLVQDTPWGGVAHHQVDVHVFDVGTGRYQGRLCIFGQCPKAGKRECLVPGCGAQQFLRQFARYHFNPEQFESEPKVILFDRARGFLARTPTMDAKPTRIVHHARADDISDEGVPF